MTAANPETAPRERLAAFLAGERVPWAAFEMPGADFLRACDEEGVAGLVHDRLRALPEACEWPSSVRDTLARAVRARAATELLRQRELTAVSDALAAGGVDVMFFKGAALAYSVYASPSFRPRVDTDLWIRRDQLSRFREIMAQLGYTAPLHCDGELLFCQFPLHRTTPTGIVHKVDCHWKISTQSIFADVLRFDEAAARAVALPGLGPHARTLSPPDALLLACIHPAMHHGNAETLIWIYDVHLLASRMSAGDLDRFATRAIEKQVAAICAHELGLAQSRFATRLPPGVIDQLTAVTRHEPSAVYLRPDRRWIDEVISSLRGLPRWRDRLRLLREIALPAPTYMAQAYGLTSPLLAAALLPALYLHRVLSGGWKLVAGRK